VSLARNARRVRTATTTRGVLPVVGACASWAVGRVAGRFATPADFTFAGVTRSCFHHPYHYTWMNERAVEIPIFRALVAGRDPMTVLEVGNVLGHYGPRRHLVVDRYERAPGVSNEDVVDFDPGRRFGLIVAISTLEHVGLDEDPREPGKPLRALERLLSLLKPGGRLVFSIPAAYNPDLDLAIRDGEAGVVDCRALRRRGRTWSEIPCEQAWTAGYDRLLYRPEAVIVATMLAQKGPGPV
jgi:SAM-dependent methyltransferase